MRIGVFCSFTIFHELCAEFVSSSSVIIALQYFVLNVFVSQLLEHTDLHGESEGFNVTIRDC